MAYSSDLVRTKNWGTEILTDADLEGQFDLIIAWVMAALNETTGHKHDATENEGPKITSAGIANDNVLFAALDDDGDYGLFTGDWSFNEIALVEDSAPATAASEMKLYTKDTGGQPELFAREESSGDEVQITDGGVVKGSVITTERIRGWIQLNGAGVIAIQDSFNVSGIVDNGEGLYTVTWDTDFANNDYAVVGTAYLAGKNMVLQTASVATGTTQISTKDPGTGTEDPTIISVIAIGDQ